MSKTVIIALGALVLAVSGVAQASPWDAPRSHVPGSYRRPAPVAPYSPHHRHVLRDRIEYRAQMRLRQLGYYGGRLDGQFGRQSRVALMRFQRDRRMRVTGMLDQPTLRALDLLPKRRGRFGR